ncbi:unnamed protein product [Porites lobata]|uniref:Uncharacterized protein n=1 Tax=Porites lobata TaxID=104759 RepID=A0ABN8QZS0_9CNID|nr:unnamed protein product [Porites lobata]
MQLSSYENLTQNNIIFKEAKEFKVKDSKIKYKRIPIEIKYSNGKKGPLVIETPFLFSFGVSEKKNQETKKLVGYSIPYCNVKLALIIEGIFISKTVTSLQIKVHECYVKPLKPRETLLTIEEEDEEQSDIEEIIDQVDEDLVISDEENE